MKLWRSIVFTIVALLSYADGWAQSSYYFASADSPSKRVEMGVSVGATYMGMSAEGVELQPKLGMRGARTMSLCWYDAVALQMELAYLHNKIEGKLGKSGYDIKSNVMEIPIMFSYRGWGPMRFNVGPVLSLAASGRYSNGVERIEFGGVRPTLGYTAGVGVELTRHIVLDARFTGGLARTDNYFEGAEFRSSAYWATLGVSYLF